MNVQIAGVKGNILIPLSDLDASFLCDSSFLNAFIVMCSASEPIVPNELHNVCNCISVTKDKNDDWLFWDRQEECIQALRCSEDHYEIQIFDCEIREFSAELLRVPLESIFVFNSIVSLHAACVELSGEAVCFTGDSGMGKSTRAKAWVDGLLSLIHI